MTQRATQVVRLLEEFRRINLPEVERAKLDSAASLNSADDHRPPKRPWEDMSQDGAVGAELPAVCNFFYLVSIKNIFINYITAIFGQTTVHCRTRHGDHPYQTCNQRGRRYHRYRPAKKQVQKEKCEFGLLVL